MREGLRPRAVLAAMQYQAANSDNYNHRCDSEDCPLGCKSPFSNGDLREVIAELDGSGLTCCLSSHVARCASTAASCADSSAEFVSIARRSSFSISFSCATHRSIAVRVRSLEVFVWPPGEGAHPVVDRPEPVVEVHVARDVAGGHHADGPAGHGFARAPSRRQRMRSNLPRRHPCHRPCGVPAERRCRSLRVSSVAKRCREPEGRSEIAASAPKVRTSRHRFCSVFGIDRTPNMPKDCLHGVTFEGERRST